VAPLYASLRPCTRSGGVLRLLSSFDADFRLASKELERSPVAESTSQAGKGACHLQHDPSQKQMTLLKGAVELLRVFAPAAAQHAHLRSTWLLHARRLRVISDTCTTHALGCKNVAPPRQEAWTKLYAPVVARYLSEGP
jgi:hypothetical protein